MARKKIKASGTSAASDSRTTETASSGAGDPESAGPERVDAPLWIKRLAVLGTAGLCEHATSLGPLCPQCQAGIHFRPVDGSVRLETIGPESDSWKYEPPFVFGGSYAGCFVRVVPPPEASDEMVTAIRAGFEAAGAKVVVLPRRRAAVVTTPREKRPHRRAREVVRDMVKSANVEDRGALGSFVDELMDRNGL
jgi:hypothetical protein